MGRKKAYQPASAEVATDARDAIAVMEQGLRDAEQRIEELESEVDDLEIENNELKEDAPNPACIGELIEFLERTELGYPSPVLYKRDLDELIRKARAA